MGRALIFGVYEKVPIARKVPYNPSILIPLGINRYEPGHGPLVLWGVPMGTGFWIRVLVKSLG